MYARLARFEGSDPAVLERDIEDMRKQIQQSMAGETPEPVAGGPDREQMELMSRAIQKVLVLADNDKGSSAMVVFCDTEDDIRKIDEMFNQMSPGEGGGKRQSVDIYEVAIDEQTW